MIRCRKTNSGGLHTGELLSLRGWASQWVHIGAEDLGTPGEPLVFGLHWNAAEAPFQYQRRNVAAAVAGAG